MTISLVPSYPCMDELKVQRLQRIQERALQQMPTTHFGHVWTSKCGRFLHTVLLSDDLSSLKSICFEVKDIKLSESSIFQFSLYPEA